MEKWREEAERYRQKAAFYRRVIERAERPGGRGSHAGWAKTKAILADIAEGFDRAAAEAEAHASRERE